MERLTERFDDGILKGILVKEKYGEHVPKTLFEEVDEGYLGMCVLKAYEDTGLAPEQIEELLSRENASEITRLSRDNDGWIPVEERMPEKNEYFVDTSSNKEFPNGYYRRLEIAYMTDTVEYIHGYYDGYKWMDEYLDAIKNVVAWRIHEPYRPERRSDEKE